MKTLFKLIVNFTLFIIAPFAEWVLMPVNVALVFAKDWQEKGLKQAVEGMINYFYESALRKDKYLCSEYRSLWNATLKTKEGEKIGVKGRSLSADLGEQEKNGTMSRTGAVVNCSLFLVERNHCRKAFLKE